MLKSHRVHVLLIMMTDKTAALTFYMKQLSEAKKLSMYEIIGGLILSLLLMGASTYGLLYYVSVLTPFNFAIADIIRYTTYMEYGLITASVIGVIICIIIVKKPRTITPLLKIHSYLKRKTGEYFICPEVPDQSMGTVIRRSLYGSILVAGIALTILSFDLMGNASEMDILAFGGYVMAGSVIVLPLTVMQLYYAPWIIKDSGLFHLDTRDRSLSNVGDDLEDLLEFVAGIDIILVWIELTINTELWVAPFTIFVVLGPLFSIMLSFTLIFTAIKDRATVSMINLLMGRYNVPDMVTSPDYIRKRVVSLVDRRMLVEEVVESKAETLTATDETVMTTEGALEEYGQIMSETARTEDTSIRDARDALEHEEEPDLMATSLKSLHDSENMEPSTEDGDEKSEAQSEE